MKDPITFAFLAMAVRSIPSEERDLAYSANEGEIGTVDIVTSYADLIDTTYTDIVGDEGWSGVFAYDVAEPMGLYVMRMLAKGIKPTETAVRDETQRLIRQYLCAA